MTLTISFSVVTPLSFRTCFVQSQLLCCYTLILSHLLCPKPTALLLHRYPFTPALSKANSSVVTPLSFHTCFVQSQLLCCYTVILSHLLVQSQQLCCYTLILSHLLCPKPTALLLHPYPFTPTLSKANCSVVTPLSFHTCFVQSQLLCCYTLILSHLLCPKPTALLLHRYPFTPALSKANSSVVTPLSFHTYFVQSQLLCCYTLILSHLLCPKPTALLLHPYPFAPALSKANCSVVTPLSFRTCFVQSQLLCCYTLILSHLLCPKPTALLLHPYPFTPAFSKANCSVVTPLSFRTCFFQSQLFCCYTLILSHLFFFKSQLLFQKPTFISSLLCNHLLVGTI